MYCTFCCTRWQLREQLELAYKQEVDEMQSNLLAGKEKVLDLDSYIDGKCLGSRYLGFAYGCSQRKNL